MITTLADIAAKAGVSVATASRALNGGAVSPKLRERVTDAANALGYVANEGARSLRSERTMTMGVIFMQLGNMLGFELLEALTAGVEEHGYNLFISTARGQEAHYDQLVQRFLERRIDALFCVNGAGEGPALDQYEKAGIPVAALFHAGGRYADLPLISPTTRAAADLAVRRLKSYGHRTIGFVRPLVRWGPIETFMEAARAIGMTIRTYEPHEGMFDAVRCLHSFLGGPGSPTAIVGQQRRVVQLLGAADELHIIVPRDLSLVAIRDRTPQPPITRLPLSMIHLNPEQVGRAAAEVMCNRLAGASLTENVKVELGSWIERGTTGPARSSAESAIRPSGTLWASTPPFGASGEWDG